MPEQRTVVVRTAAAAARSDDLVLGRYRPLKPLGSGGSGSVWLARDERSGLDVALKIVAREGKAGARAEREARAAAALRHPRCLRAYSLGRDPSHVYIAYEYVPGRTLREAMRADELDDRGVVEAAAQILEGLAHAHARGIVHRDVKPANVLLAEAGDELDVRLLDFGLALIQDEQTLTARGDVPGTLAYISPERLAGEPARPAADVWAVGVILWEALAGRHPFWDGSPLQMQKAILAGAPPLEEIRPDLPKSLRETICSALVENPSRRPTAAELAEALRNRLRKGRRKGPGMPVVPPRPRVGELPGRAVPAALAAAVAGWTAAELPFYPAHWPIGLAAAAAVADAAPAARRARLRARGAVLPARERGARARGRLCRRRAALARAHVARPARRAALRGRASARAARGPRSAAARRAMGARAGATRGDGGGRRAPLRGRGRDPRGRRCRSGSARRPSTSGSSAATAPARSRTRSGPRSSTTPRSRSRRPPWLSPRCSCRSCAAAARGRSRSSAARPSRPPCSPRPEAPSHRSSPVPG